MQLKHLKNVLQPQVNCQYFHEIVWFFFLHVHENVWSQINLDIVNIYESGKDSAGGNQSPKWEWITQYNDSPFGIICFTMWLFGRAHNWRLTDYSTLFFLWQCQLALLPSLSTPPLPLLLYLKSPQSYC